jgi:hypothetical protein
MNYYILDTFLHISSVNKIPTTLEYQNILCSNKEILINAKLKIGSRGQKIAWTGKSP